MFNTCRVLALYFNSDSPISELKDLLKCYLRCYSLEEQRCFDLVELQGMALAKEDSKRDSKAETFTRNLHLIIVDYRLHLLSQYFNTMVAVNNRLRISSRQLQHFFDAYRNNPQVLSCTSCYTN